MGKEFCHIHGHSFHSNWSGPDALPSPTDIATRAADLGLESICLTDHASISGIPDFVEACAELTIKPTVGAELYVCDDPAWRPAPKGKGDAEATGEEGKGKSDYNHVVALAKNWEGFIELCSLISAASRAPNFYRRPRNSYADLFATKNLVFSTACAGGILKRDDAEGVLGAFRDAVGPERLYLEIQPHVDKGQMLVNRRAVALSAALGLPLVAAQDFHYARPGDNATHEVLLAVGSGSVMSDPARWKYPVDDLHIKSKAEMLRAFVPWVRQGLITPAQLQDSFANAQAIVSGLDFQWRDLPVSLPELSADPQGAVLALCAAAMKAKGLHARPEYLKRLAYEMKVLIDAGILQYFLILHDITAWSRRQGIMVGPGRGSAGGSLVAFLLGITTIDPLLHGLIFERFYRPGRVDLPDIDSDFCQARRPEVLAYIESRYGKDYVASVATYSTVKARGALKDVSRVYEISHLETNAVTQAIAVPDIQIDDLAAIAAHNREVLDDPAVRGYFAKYPVIEPHVRKLCGWMRGTGQHAAGVVIAGVPVAERAAVMHGKDDARVVCWDKWVVERLGLMKLDVLGLRTMTILGQAAENVFKARGRKVVYEELALDDARTLKAFDDGRTTGVFQCEGSGMRRVFKECRVDRFSIIADVISLYRPGPMDLIPRYQAAQQGTMAVTFKHPLLEPILAPTFGVLIYQEQLMAIFSELGGFDYAHADKMRKIVGKKLGPDEFRKHQDDFVAGAVAKGVEPGVAEGIFNEMVAFAGYGFNKSHAVAYALIAYWCAYMKENYPAEFWAAHLSTTDNAEKLELAIADVVKEKITIVMPDVNVSHATRFVPVNDAVIMAPLTAIKGLGEKAAELIVGARLGTTDPNGLVAGETRAEAKRSVSFDAARTRAGAFVDASDFDQRVYARIVNVRVKDSLGRVGALPWRELDAAVLKANRRELLGAVFKEVIAVDRDAALAVDEFTKAALERTLSALPALRQETAMVQALPAMGAKPRILVVCSTPEYKDEKHAQMCHGDGWATFYQLMKAELKCQPKDFYVTALYKCRKPPVGYERWKAAYEEILHAEIGTLKPPLIVALGKDAIEFFAGAGAKTGKLHATVAVWREIPVVYGFSPVQVVMEPGKAPEFRKLADTIRGILV